MIIMIQILNTNKCIIIIYIKTLFVNDFLFYTVNCPFTISILISKIILYQLIFHLAVIIICYFILSFAQ